MTEEMKIQIRSEKRWPEKSVLIYQYHMIQQATRDTKRTYKWTLEDSSRELEVSVGYLSEALKLAKEILKGNFIGESLTREEALKRIRNGN